MGQNRETGETALRPTMKRFSFLVSIFAISLSLAVVFQNCGTYQTGINPLTDDREEAECIGVSCKLDLEFVELVVANAQPIGIKKPTTTPKFCDPSTCFDLAGYCNTAGYKQSYIYYQWRLNNSLIGQRITTGLGCDSMGRFRILVQIPPPQSHTFNYGDLYSVEVSMTVVDENDVEQGNPTAGVSTKLVPVVGID